MDIFLIKPAGKACLQELKVDIESVLEYFPFAVFLA